MTEQHGEPTRYLSFKVDKFADFLQGPIRTALSEITKEQEGLTFDELLERTNLGPRHLRNVLRQLFERDYIITNHQMAKIRQKTGVDVEKLRGYRP